MSEPTISTFVMVKDEDETIERTLRSAAKFSDEIVIGIDDKTTDQTPQKAAEAVFYFKGEIYIYEFTWTDSFADARNTAIEKCSKDWIWQMDAHEYVRPGDEVKIKGVCRTIEPHIWLVAVEMWDDWDKNWQYAASRWAQDHLWRNGKGIKYDFAMHNAITAETVPPENRAKILEIVIYHQRTEENAKIRLKQRIEMAEKIFLPKIEENPGDLRSIFYMAQTYLNSVNLDKAEEYYWMYLDRSEEQGIPHPSENAWCLYKLGMIDMERGGKALEEKNKKEKKKNEKEGRKRFENAITWHLNALRYRADSPEIFNALGDSLLALDEMDQALMWYFFAMNTKPYSDHLFQQSTAFEYAPYAGAARIYFQKKQWDKAFKAAIMGASKAPSLGICQEIASKALLAGSKQIPKKHANRKNLYVVDATRQFTGRLLEDWEKEYNVIVEQKVDPAKMKWSDITFVEWADQNLLEAAQHKIGCRLITRIHSYEAFAPWLMSINWRNVSSIIYYSNRIKEHVLSQTAENICLNWNYVPLSVDIEKWPLLKEQNEKNIAVMCRLVPIKNVQMMLEIMAEMPTDYKLHIAGTWQDKRYENFIYGLVKQYGIERRIIWHGWQEDINAWLETIKPTYLLSASVIESQGLNICEAMAKGIKPVIYNFADADEHYPFDKYLFTGQAVAMLQEGNPDPQKWRNIIAERYNYTREKAEFDKIFKGEKI
jgi:glycosyltransferase involved in cell wall biosynthesis